MGIGGLKIRQEGQGQDLQTNGHRSGRHERF